ncbi:MAG: ADP-ribose pyrophosphatase, partial [Aquabacterium sp.]|nr:ADP-ribose pyrophosphatase [Aquabacterium sp.]
LDVFAASQDELESWMQAGQLTDAKTIVGMMWLQRWRAGHCQLTWQTVA